TDGQVSGVSGGVRELTDGLATMYLTDATTGLVTDLSDGLTGALNGLSSGIKSGDVVGAVGQTTDGLLLGTNNTPIISGVMGGANELLSGLWAGDLAGGLTGFLNGTGDGMYTGLTSLGNDIAKYDVIGAVDEGVVGILTGSGSSYAPAGGPVGTTSGSSPSAVPSVSGEQESVPAEQETSIEGKGSAAQENVPAAQEAVAEQVAAAEESVPAEQETSIEGKGSAAQENVSAAQEAVAEQVAAAEESVPAAQEAVTEEKAPVASDTSGREKVSPERGTATEQVAIADKSVTAGQTITGIEVDKDVSPEMPVERLRVTLRNVQFDFDKVNVKEIYAPDIAKAADYMKKNPETTAVIEGHTCDIGSAQYNMRLSAERAQSVGNYMTDVLGIDPRRITVKGYGSTRPAASNATKKGKEMNRRVEIVIS
ncbi:MAG: OmpA family protein, partial [Smithellaceae bacterium]|nr:OmpA family protein [Smithellaceae bacterium]